MKSKAIFCLSPILPQASDLDSFSRCLDFLKPNYTIYWLDTLERFEPGSFKTFQAYWHQQLQKSIETFDTYVGFSLGGTLLAHCMDVLSQQNKKILLISTPCLMDNVLQSKLSRILELVQRGDTLKALETLQASLYDSDNPTPMISREEADLPMIRERLTFGLAYLLNDRVHPTPYIEQTPFYQMVGEHSQLVTSSNVFKTKLSTTQIVPHAGMRVLEDNPTFCETVIRQWLEDDK